MPVATIIARQRGHLFPWAPVWIGLGIGAYFAQRAEPPTALLWGLLIAAVVLCWLARRASEAAGPLLLALALAAVGFGWAGLRAQQVASPVLEFRYYGPVEGRVVDIDRSLSDAVRITLDHVVLLNTAPDRTPHRVRVSLHGAQGFTELVPGGWVILTAHLSPPMGPAEPGGFDFRRHAWFDRLGAVGYTRTPVLALAPPDRASRSVRLTAMRLSLAEAIRARIPGQPGAFAAAVSTGDRSGLSRETLDAMRGSNLAHLLAISGLHMGLLTGVVFAALRGGIALWPYVALRVDARKWAASLSFLAAIAYLALSGGSVATQRAFVMVAVVLVAVLGDRRALTLRAVAVAALLILLWRPESLLGPGFQMSFAATTALVWAFAMLRAAKLTAAGRWWQPVMALVISSAVAGLATAPFGAAHFNRIAQLGLLANLSAVPVMGLIVMPAAVAAAVLAPLGLAGPALWVMGRGCAWILGVAEWIAGRDVAILPVVAPPGAVLPLIALGGLWVVLWQGWGRLAGIVPCVVALALWLHAPRPPILIADTGGLVGVMTPEGRALSTPRGNGFVARAWLENDGDLRAQAAAYREDALSFGEVRVRLLTEAGWRRAEAPCADADIVVTRARVPDPPDACRVIDIATLRDAGALALWPARDGLRMETVAQRVGRRYWSDRDLRRAVTRADQ